AAATEPERSVGTRPRAVEQSGPEPLCRAVPRTGCLLRMDDGLGLCLYLRPAERDEPCGCRRRSRMGRGARADDRAPGPGHSRLLQGHAATDQAGPGPGP